MIRNRKSRDDKPYRRVTCPPEIRRRLDEIAELGSQQPASGSTETQTRESTRRHPPGFGDPEERPSDNDPPIPLNHSTNVYPHGYETDTEVLSDTLDTNRVDEHEDDALVATAVRIANEPGFSVHADGHSPSRVVIDYRRKPSARKKVKLNTFSVDSAQRASSGTNVPLASTSQYGRSSSYKSRPNTGVSAQGPSRPGGHPDAEGFRTEMLEAFDDFVARATRIMDRHLDAMY